MIGRNDRHKFWPIKPETMRFLAKVLNSMLEMALTHLNSPEATFASFLSGRSRF